MSRYIDSLPTPAHVKPKKLIVLSASRTGTHGLYSAFKLLGFNPFHMAEVLQAGASMAKIMNDGMLGELGRKKPYTRKEFDKWFADYDIIIEMPSFMLQSMLRAYPEAEFLLVERSPEKWAKSFENTIGKLGTKTNQFPGMMMQLFDGTAYQLGTFSKTLLGLYTKGEGMTEQGKKNLVEHYKEYIATVKRSVPPNRLKVMTLEDGFGWQEICPLVGVPVPKNLEWPGRNTPDEFHQIAKPLFWKAVSKTILGMTTILGTIIVAGVWYRRAGGKLPRLGFLS